MNQVSDRSARSIALDLHAGDAAARRAARAQSPRDAAPQGDDLDLRRRAGDRGRSPSCPAASCMRSRWN